MIRIVASALLAVSALIAAPQAGADPQDLVPYCSGDQTPADDNCQPMPHQVFGDGAPGANPELPVGVNPDLKPVV